MRKVVQEEPDGKLVPAKSLRDKAKLAEIPGDSPGWYRWWAPRNVTEKLLNSSFVKHHYFDEIESHLDRQIGDDVLYYCIYAGVAKGQSVGDRLRKHVNGTWQGSTLRESLSAVLAGNHLNEWATDGALDQMLVQFFVLPEPINSEAAKYLLNEIERSDLKEKTLPLNIKGNERHKLLESFTSDLVEIRKRISALAAQLEDMRRGETGKSHSNAELPRVPWSASANAIDATREEFAAWLRSWYPNQKSISPTVAMAFFLRQYGSEPGISLGDLVSGSVSSDAYRDALRSHFALIGRKNPTGDAATHLRAIELFRTYLQSRKANAGVEADDEYGIDYAD